MNFKLFFALIFLTSCGLKTTPTKPQGTNLPSLIDQYSKSYDVKKPQTDKKARKKNK